MIDGGKHRHHRHYRHAPERDGGVIVMQGEFDKPAQGGVDAAWLRQGPYYWTGPGGCQVAACRLGPATAARWRFTAWGAEEMPGLAYWQWQAAVKPPVCYARGEPVARRRPWLGVHDTAAAARAACLAWLAGPREDK